MFRNYIDKSRLFTGMRNRSANKIYCFNGNTTSRGHMSRHLVGLLSDVRIVHSVATLGIVLVKGWKYVIVYADSDVDMAIVNKWVDYTGYEIETYDFTF